MENLSKIEISLNHYFEGLKITIFAKNQNTLFDSLDSHSQNNEARYQLIEGQFYDYEISNDDFILGDIGENIIQTHRGRSNLGTISPNINVGTLEIPVIKIDEPNNCTTFQLEVQSIKTGYRDDYRDMLEFITEKCTDLVIKSNTPIFQSFNIDFTRDSQSLYQRFSFINSIIGTSEFRESIHRIITFPVTKWAQKKEIKDIRNVKKFSNSNIKELISKSKRTKLTKEHFLKSYGLSTLPDRISNVQKTDSVDTPENRFVKHALESFLNFSTEINKASTKDSRLYKESQNLVLELEQQLQHNFFNSISNPETLKLNSPVLQRKEGYREILRIWLMFDLAAKLTWQGGEDVYGAGKKNIATLYEYWLFFKLLDLFQEIFNIEPNEISSLIQLTEDGLGIQLKQGKSTPILGTFDAGSRKLNVRFNYNRTFKGGKSYPESGSWTTTLRPDYTLSFWPLGITELEAERQELIVHIHFDAKYKINDLQNLLELNTSDYIEKEKHFNRKGIYKNADLLKMHAYKDAIRRTGGAYVLYPGEKSKILEGFHEIIPGLGAFSIRPSKTNDGIGDLKIFIRKVLNHFLNRASQREKIAYQTFVTYKIPPNSEKEIREILPEPFNGNRALIPDDTFVLVGYCKNKSNIDWYKKEGKYNFRMDDDKGSLVLDNKVVNSKYLLLREAGKDYADKFFKIKSKGPKVVKGESLKGYKSKNLKDYYLVIEIDENESNDFNGAKIDFKKLAEFKEISSKNNPVVAAGVPFAVSLTELMQVVIK